MSLVIPGRAVHVSARATYRGPQRRDLADGLLQQPGRRQTIENGKFLRQREQQVASTSAVLGSRHAVGLR
jgi:hypothetical protein